MSSQPEVIDFKKPVLTKRQATQGKKINLHKQYKGIATTIRDKADRRHYLNMMLQMTRIRTEKPIMVPRGARGPAGAGEDSDV